jgi:hypothetical protein
MDRGILMVLTLGVGVGVACGTARADNGTGTVVTVPCGPSGNAVQAFPGRTKEDLAANVFHVSPSVPPAAFSVQGVAYYQSDAVLMGVAVADGSVAVGCGPNGSAATLYVR